jgi:simple sugar transport system ATP-binding protein
LDNCGKPLLDLRSASARVRDLGRQYGLEVDPSARVSDLPIGIQQRVEILKALFRGVELLILDEPPAVLTPLEVRDFFSMLKRLVENGLSSIFISHKLDEVLEISQRITVLNRGKKIGTLLTKDATQQQLADMMVGHSVNLTVGRKQHQKDRIVLSVRHLSKTNPDGLPVLKDISFDVSAGEIFGIAGVDGNGQQELIDALIGLAKPDSGSVELNGKAISGKSPKKIIDSGVSCVPADRQRTGAVMELSVSDNLIMKRSDAQPYARHGILDKKAIQNISKKIILQYDIRTMGTEAVFSSLSGGNQQKVVLAREIESSPKLLIVCYPTRGLDIGATEYVHSCILEQRDKNVAVILVSSELEEVMSLSDRIAVFFRGEIMGILDNNTQPQLDTIGKMMLGENLEALNEAES